MEHTMPYPSFTELQNAVLAHGQRGDFAAAYALLTTEGARFSDEAGIVLYLRSCMAERLGQRADALATLTEALDQGHWYGERLLRQSPSWQPLQGDPTFEQLAARSLALQDAALNDMVPLVAQPADAPPPAGWPTLITLHGSGGNPRLSLAGWRPAAHGWLLAAFHSSQALSSQQFVWNDLAQARTDVLVQLAALRAAHPLDARRLLLGGFSGGAGMALQLALTGALTVRGFVLLSPGGPLLEDPERCLPLIREAAGRQLRAAVVIGAEDAPRLVDAALQLTPLLDDNGIPCHLEVVQGLGHAYPQDEGAALRRGLAFVSQ
jgi:predicted esterase